MFHILNGSMKKENNPREYWVKSWWQEGLEQGTIKRPLRLASLKIINTYWPKCLHGRIQVFGLDSPAKIAYLACIPNMHFPSYSYIHEGCCRHSGRKPCIWRSYRIHFPFCVWPYIFLLKLKMIFLHTCYPLFSFQWAQFLEQPTVSPVAALILHNFPRPWCGWGRTKSSDSSPENTSMLELGGRRAASMESSSVLKHWKSVPLWNQTAFQIYLFILFIRVICH